MQERSCKQGASEHNASRPLSPREEQNSRSTCWLVCGDGVVLVVVVVVSVVVVVVGDNRTAMVVVVVGLKVA